MLKCQNCGRETPVLRYKQVCERCNKDIKESQFARFIADMRFGNMATVCANTLEVAEKLAKLAELKPGDELYDSLADNRELFKKLIESATPQPPVDEESARILFEKEGRGERMVNPSE